MSEILGSLLPFLNILIATNDYDTGTLRNELFLCSSDECSTNKINKRYQFLGSGVYYEDSDRNTPVQPTFYQS